MDKRNLSVELKPPNSIEIRPYLNTANSPKTKLIQEPLKSHKANKIENLRNQLSIMKSSIVRPFIRPGFRSK